MATTPRLHRSRGRGRKLWSPRGLVAFLTVVLVTGAATGALAVPVAPTASDGTQDIGTTPGAFGQALASRIGPYRITREALRHVVKHARARRVRAEVAGSPDGHLGLRLLSDTLDDFGGSVELGATAGGGVIVVARFPADLVPSYPSNLQGPP